jgi:hypothetical protein
MTSQFVTGGANLPHQGRMMIRDPTQRVERRSRIELRQQLENAVRIGDDTLWIRTPTVAVNVTFECSDLKVILYVHRKGIYL